MIRVLFVDDEPNILAGLQRMLRPQREQWEMVFVTSGAAAVDALEGGPFDVVVTDMRMPEMDGLELLKEVQQRSPRTVRIVLSGHSSEQMTFRSTAVSHQFLAKPCDPDRLKDAVDRARQLNDLVHDPLIQARIGRVSGLPSLPRIFREMCAALASPIVDIGQVAEIVARDQGLTVKVLQLVNSSFFGVQREITSIRHATSYLGARTLRDLVLSTEVFRMFEGAAVPGFRIEDEQAHSSLTARIARRLFADREAAEEAFLAAMLHDVGRLVMAVEIPDALAHVLPDSVQATGDDYRSEKQLLGFDHAQVGAYLLELWGMPYTVVEAVAYHHQLGRVAASTRFGTLAAVHVADCLAGEVAATGGEPPGQVDQGLLARLGVLGRLEEWRALAVEEALRESHAA